MGEKLFTGTFDRTYVSGVRIEGNDTHFDCRRLVIEIREGKIVDLKDVIGDARDLLPRG